MTYQNALKFASHLSPGITQDSFPCTKRTKKKPSLGADWPTHIIFLQKQRNNSPQLLCSHKFLE